HVDAPARDGDPDVGLDVQRREVVGSWDQRHLTARAKRHVAERPGTERGDGAVRHFLKARADGKRLALQRQDHRAVVLRQRPGDGEDVLVGERSAEGQVPVHDAAIADQRAAARLRVAVDDRDRPDFQPRPGRHRRGDVGAIANVHVARTQQARRGQRAAMLAVVEVDDPAAARPYDTATRQYAEVFTDADRRAQTGHGEIALAPFGVGPRGVPLELL